MESRTEPPGAPMPGPKPPAFDVGAMATQLQAMIDEVVRVSSPALREIAVKAAELAAVAGEHAGPVARTIAARTDEVGHAVARHASAFAESHRAPHDAPAAEAPDPAPPGSGSGPPV